MKKSIISILLVVNGFAYSAIWLVALMHFYYYDAAMEALNITNTQFGLLGSVYGVVSICSYIFGGIVSDKFKTKTLLLATYVLQILITFIYSLFPSYRITVLLVFLATTVCVIIYYSAMAKYVRSLGDASHEASLYGIHYAFVGIGGTVCGFIGAGLITSFGNIDGLRYLLYINMAIMAVAFIINLLLYKPKDIESSENDKFCFKDIFAIIKLPVFWFAGIAGHCLSLTVAFVTYTAPMLSDLFAAPVFIVSLIGTFRLYMARAIFAPVGGVIIDKTGSSLRYMGWILVAAVIAGIAMIIMPWNPTYYIPACIIVVVVSIVFNMSVPTWFSPISEMNIPEKMRGTAIGALSTVLFFSDTYIYLLAGYLIDSFSGNTGYTILFSYLTFFFAIGAVAAFLGYRKVKQKKTIAE